jgi:hypothetical protein
LLIFIFWLKKLQTLSMTRQWKIIKKSFFWWFFYWTNKIQTIEIFIFLYVQHIIIKISSICNINISSWLNKLWFIIFFKFFYKRRINCICYFTLINSFRFPQGKRRIQVKFWKIWKRYLKSLTSNKTYYNFLLSLVIINGLS